MWSIIVQLGTFVNNLARMLDIGMHPFQDSGMTSFQTDANGAAREAGEARAARVAAEVRAEMARQGKSKGELAQALGVTLNTAKSRYSGSQPYNVVELVQVALWLGVGIDYLAEAAA